VFVIIEFYDYHFCEQNGQVTQGKCSFKKIHRRSKRDRLREVPIELMDRTCLWLC